MQIYYNIRFLQLRLRSEILLTTYGVVGLVLFLLKLLMALLLIFLYVVLIGVDVITILFC